jgi:hypothetical protein
MHFQKVLVLDLLVFAVSRNIRGPFHKPRLLVDVPELPHSGYPVGILKSEEAIWVVGITMITTHFFRDEISGKRDICQQKSFRMRFPRIVGWRLSEIFSFETINQIKDVFIHNVLRKISFFRRPHATACFIYLIWQVVKEHFKALFISLTLSTILAMHDFFAGKLLLQWR